MSPTLRHTLILKGLCPPLLKPVTKTLDSLTFQYLITGDKHGEYDRQTVHQK